MRRAEHKPLRVGYGAGARYATSWT